MNNRAKKLLFDVLASGRSIRQWCSGRSFGDYEGDRQFRRAVEREFEIIGEALSRLRVPRSRIFTVAVEEFLDRHASRGLEAALDRAYRDSPDAAEKNWLAATRRKHRRLVQGEP